MERRFGFLQATALNMSNMMGAGPFITIPLLMSAMGGPQAMLGWIVALVIWLRRNEPQMERPFRMWLYPLPAFIALCGWVYLIVTQDRVQLLYASIILVVGCISYFAWRMKGK